jgi:hypothetical protein
VEFQEKRIAKEERQQWLFAQRKEQDHQRPQEQEQQ